MRHCIVPTPAELVPSQELGQAGEVELYAIPPGQGGQGFEIGWPLPSQERSQLLEVAGKGARSNHLQKSDRASARVPEGVKDATPLEDRFSHPAVSIRSPCCTANSPSSTWEISSSRAVPVERRP